MIILRYHEIFSSLQHQQPCRDTLALLAWKKSHDIVILSFGNIVKGQAKCEHLSMEQEYKKTFPKSKAFNVGTKEELKLPLLKYNQPV